MTHRNACLVFLVSMLSFGVLSVGQPIAYGKGVLTFSGIRPLIESAYKTRSELLANSTGVADLSLDRRIHVLDDFKHLGEEFVDNRGLNEAGLNYPKQGKWKVKWYRKGINNRYDTFAASNTESDTINQFSTYLGKRIATNPERSLLYTPATNTAYINKPPRNKAINPAYLLAYFSVGRLYKVSNMWDLPVLLGRWSEDEHNIRIRTSKVGDLDCVQMVREGEREVSPGVYRRWREELIVSPKLSYAVVAYRNMGNRSTGFKELKLLEEYSAEYERADDYQDVWLLKRVSIHEAQGMTVEKLICEFSDVKVGVDVPDSVFTFEGLGVPPGAKVYDKTLGGRSRGFYYKPTTQGF